MSLEEKKILTETIRFNNTPLLRGDFFFEDDVREAVQKIMEKAIIHQVVFEGREVDKLFLVPFSVLEEELGPSLIKPRPEDTEVQG